MAHETYARLMKKLKRGDALWDPSPGVISIRKEAASDQSGTRVRDPKVEVGHLGYIEDGKWRHIFDIHGTQESHHRAENVPSDLFERMRRPYTGISAQDPVGPLHFTPAGSAEFSFRATEVAGNSTAVDGPPSALNLSYDASLFCFGPSQRSLVPKHDTGRYKEYVVRNYDQWKALIQRNNWSISADRFGVVIDRTLTRSWITSVQTEHAANNQIGVEVSINSIAAGGLSLSFSHDSMEIAKNCGPSTRLSTLPTSLNASTIESLLVSQDESATSGPLDQCVFVMLIKAADMEWYRRIKDLRAPRHSFAKISLRAGASLANQGGQNAASHAPQALGALTGSQESTLSSSVPDSAPDLAPENEAIMDLSSIALWYILDNAEVQKAIFCDCDIFPYIDDVSNDEGWFEALVRLRPRIYTYTYDGNTLGSLSELDFGTIIEKPDVTIPLLVEALAQDISVPSSPKLYATPCTEVPEVRKHQKDVLRLHIPLEDDVHPVFKTLALELERLRLDPQLIILASRDEAELSLVTTPDGQVQFNLTDSLSLITKYGINRLYSTVQPDRRAIRPVLQAAARFFWLLRRLPDDDILRAKVEIDFHRVKLSERSMVELEDIYEPDGDSLICGGVIDLEADAETKYGVTIRNKVSTPMYASLFYFDCSDLSITSYYLHPYPCRCLSGNLRAHGTLPIGYGGGVRVPHQYFLRDGQDKDVGFLKLFLSTGRIDLNNVAQSSPFNTADTKWQGKKEKKGTTTTWDAVTIALVQRAPGPRPPCTD